LVVEYGIFWWSLIVKLDVKITRNNVGMSSEKYLKSKIVASLKLLQFKVKFNTTVNYKFSLPWKSTTRKPDS
jgi:hypothetical protein